MRDPVTLLSVVDVATIDPEVQKVIGHVTKGSSAGTVPAIFYVGRFEKKHKFSTVLHIMLVTSAGIITYRPDGTLSRSVPLLAIKEVFVFPDMFNVLSIPSQHDFLFRLERPAEIDFLINILQVLKKAYEPGSSSRSLPVSSFGGSYTTCPKKVNLTKKGKEPQPIQVPFIKPVTSDLGSMDTLLRPPRPPKEERGELAVKEINARIGAVLAHPLFYPPPRAVEDAQPKLPPPRKPSSEHAPKEVVQASASTASEANVERPPMPTIEATETPRLEETKPAGIPPSAHLQSPQPFTPARQHLDLAHAPSISRTPVTKTPHHTSPPPPPPSRGVQGYSHRVRVYTPLPAAAPPPSAAPLAREQPPHVREIPDHRTTPPLLTRPSVSSFEASVATLAVEARITVRQRSVDARIAEVNDLMGQPGIHNALLVGLIQEELDELLQGQSRDRSEKARQDMEIAESKRRAVVAAAAAEAEAKEVAARRAQQEAEQAAAKEIEATLSATPQRPTQSHSGAYVDPSTPEYAHWYYTKYLPYASRMPNPGRTNL